jgi:hypothetical protein
VDTNRNESGVVEWLNCLNRPGVRVLHAFSEENEEILFRSEIDVDN